MSNLIERRNRIREAVPHLSTASGSIASFQTDMRSALEEIKIHFNPQQASGTPSPSSPIPIYGWTGCDLWKTGKNMLHNVGYSAYSIASPTSAMSISNSYGTTLSTINPTESVTITQSQWSASPIYSYRNGYCNIIDDNLIFGHTYNISFRITNITNNPLEASLSDLQLYNPGGYNMIPIVDGDRLFYRNFVYNQNTSIPNRHELGIRVCGMSLTLSDIIVTEVADSPTPYEPYVGNQIPVSWSSLGTVYGGWVNPVSGEVWSDWEMASARWGDIKRGNPDGTTGFYEGALNFSGRVSEIHYSTDIDKVKCNILNTIMWAGASRTPEHFYVDNLSLGYGRAYIYGNYSDDTTVQMAIKRETPVLVDTISPIQLKTLVGANNIWANTNGNIDVRYWKH